MNSRLKARVEMIVSHINADPDGHGGPGKIQEMVKERLGSSQWVFGYLFADPYRFRRDQNPCYTPKDAVALASELGKPGFWAFCRVCSEICPCSIEDLGNYVCAKCMDNDTVSVPPAPKPEPKPAEQKVRRFRAKDGSGTWEGTNDTGVLKTRDGREHSVALLNIILKNADEWEEVTA